jgi:hypothetical protein
MVSAAMLMLADLKPTNGQPVSVDQVADQSKPWGMSFAKSLSDRVAESALLQEKSSVEDAAFGSPGVKPAVPGKNLDAVAAIPDEAKGKISKFQGLVAGNKLTGAAVTHEVVEAQAVAVTGEREKTVEGDSVASNLKSPIEEAAEPVPSSSTSCATSPVATAGENVLPPASIADEKRPIVSQASSLPVQKGSGTGKIGKAKESVAAKKTERTQENPTGSKNVSSSVVSNENAAFQPVMPVSKEETPPLFQGVVTGGPRNDAAGKVTGDGFNRAERGDVSSGASSAIQGGVVHKESGQGTRAAALGTETTATSSDGQLQVAKPDAELEKIGAAVSTSGDGGDKTQSATGPALAHSIAGSDVIAGPAPIAIVSDNLLGELNATKVTVGDVEIHTAGLVAGSGYPERLAVVGASMDGMPRMLTATPTALEVGIQSGTHGWLKVRAEMGDGGAVNASVSAVSSTGQEMLHRELPALAAYLQQEKVAVNALAVHTPLAAGAEPRSSTGMDNAGGQTPQGDHEGSEQQQNIGKAILSSSDDTMSYQSLPGDEDGSLSLATYASGGNWLNVRA